MKRFFFYFLSVFVCYEMQALPLGNPMEASLLCNGFVDGIFCSGSILPCDWLNVRVGYYGDFVFNRYLQIDRTGHDKIEDFELYTSAGYLALNLCNRLEVFATLGATNASLHTNVLSFNAALSNGRLDVIFDDSFSYSVGGRGTLLSYCCTSLGAEFQYFYTSPHVTRFGAFDAITGYPSRDEFLKYREWQVGLGIAHSIRCFVPYLGIKWSHVQGKLPDDAGTKLQNAKYWGYAFGTSLVVCDAINLTVEGRFADEKAVYVNGQLRF